MSYTDYRNTHRYKHYNLCWLEGEDQLVSLLNFYIIVICICYIYSHNKIVFILNHIIKHFVLFFIKWIYYGNLSIIWTLIY